MEAALLKSPNWGTSDIQKSNDSRGAVLESITLGDTGSKYNGFLKSLGAKQRRGQWLGVGGMRVSQGSVPSLLTS